MNLQKQYHAICMKLRELHKIGGEFNAIEPSKLTPEQMMQAHKNKGAMQALHKERERIEKEWQSEGAESQKLFLVATTGNEHAGVQW